MTQTTEMPQYEPFQRQWDGLNLNISASELHGVICGMLCAGNVEAHANWIEGLFHGLDVDASSVEQARQLLGQLYFASQQQLADAEIRFAPFIPEDEQLLTHRARGFADWCQGYLYGLGLAGLTEQQLGGDTRELLQDINEFARLDYVAVANGDAEESEFAQLAEFLRVAVLLIWEELSGKREELNVGK